MAMNNHFLRISLAVFLTAATLLTALADENTSKNEFNPITTGVASLSIAPDARGASMGDIGASTDPDVNSQYWNPSKYAFAYSSAGVGISYTPWLRKLVNDIFLANVAGYWKMGSGDNQALAGSLRYFSLGEVQFTDEGGGSMTTINPYELAFDLSYSRKLSEKYSMGVALRYIYSNLGFTSSYTGDLNKGASAFAADIAGYFTYYPMIGRSECQWSWGYNISNIGSKLSYNGGNDVAFIPTNLKLGTTFAFPLADYHTLAVSLDLNKLLVPTRPRRSDYEEGAEGDQAYEDALQKWKDMSPITGIFKSFTDKPNGFKEVLQEINISVGLEYNYNQQFFLRGGYFREHANKGNRQYFGFGAGFSLNVVRLDAAYMIATAQTSPLDQTLRFTLTFDMDGLKELLGRRRR